MPDTYDEYTQAAANRDPAPGALRAHIEADGARKALDAAAAEWDLLPDDHYARRDAALWLTERADRIEQENRP